MAGPGVVGRSLVVGPDGVVGLELDEEPAVRTVDIDGAALLAASASRTRAWPTAATRCVPRERAPSRA